MKYEVKVNEYFESWQVRVYYTTATSKKEAVQKIEDDDYDETDILYINETESTQYLEDIKNSDIKEVKKEKQ